MANVSRIGKPVFRLAKRAIQEVEKKIDEVTDDGKRVYTRAQNPGRKTRNLGKKEAEKRRVNDIAKARLERRMRGGSKNASRLDKAIKTGPATKVLSDLKKPQLIGGYKGAPVTVGIRTKKPITGISRLPRDLSKKPIIKKTPSKVASQGDVDVTDAAKARQKRLDTTVGKRKTTPIARKVSGNPTPNRGGGLKTTTGQPRRKVSNYDARTTAVEAVGRRPHNATRIREVTKPDNTIGVGRAEGKKMRVKQKVTVTKVNPKVLQERLKIKKKAEADARAARLDTTPPARPAKQPNAKPVKRDVNKSRQQASVIDAWENKIIKTKVDVRDKDIPLLEESKTGVRRDSRPTIDSRESDYNRGKHVEKASTKRDKQADKIADKAIKIVEKAEKGKASTTSRAVPKSVALRVLRTRWKTAGPEERTIIEKQAAKLSEAPKKIIIKPKQKNNLTVDQKAGIERRARLSSTRGTVPRGGNTGGGLNINNLNK